MGMMSWDLEEPGYQLGSVFLAKQTVSRLCPKRRRKPAETARKAAKGRGETV